MKCMLRECETFFRSGVETWFGYQQVFLDAPYEAKRAVAGLLTWCERCKHRGDHAEDLVALRELERIAAQKARNEPSKGQKLARPTFNPNKTTIGSLTGRTMPPHVAAPKLSEAEERRAKQKRMADILQTRLSRKR